jgi:hypothetical protein
VREPAAAGAAGPGGRARWSGTGHGVFVEMSGHPGLTVPIGAAVEASGGVAVGSLRRGEGGRGQLLLRLAELHCHGVEVKWDAVLPAGPVVAELPTVRVQRQRYWLGGGRAAATRGAGAGARAGTGCSAAVSLPDGGVGADGAGGAHQPGVARRSRGARAGAGAGHGAARAGAARGGAGRGGQRGGAGAGGADAGAGGGGLALRVLVAPVDDGWTVAIHARAEDAADDGAWTLHAEGRLVIGAGGGSESCACGRRRGPRRSSSRGSTRGRRRRGLSTGRGCRGCGRRGGAAGSCSAEVARRRARGRGVRGASGAARRGAACRAARRGGRWRCRSCGAG